MHVYIHVPFCRRRCSYCDFAIAVRRQVPSERFVAAVLAERETRALSEGWIEATFDTVYFGGGTPSRLSADAVARLLERFPRSRRAEVTLEANPEDVTPGKAAAWRKAGVNRISLGVQSFQPTTLAWMRRTHDRAAAERAVGAVRDAGIPRCSIDLIFGLPPVLEHDPRLDVEHAIRLAPDHISAYGLTLEPRTPYARWVSAGRATPVADARYEQEYFVIHRLLTDAGYEHYEVSNYARGRRGRGRRARHNGAYWSGAEYLGLGPAAHGYARGRRRWNRREWVAYERAVVAGEDPLEADEVLTPEQCDLERVYLGLRTADGLERSSVRVNETALATFVERGWVRLTERRVAATPGGWLVLDEIVAALTTFPEGG